MPNRLSSAVKARVIHVPPSSTIRRQLDSSSLIQVSHAFLPSLICHISVDPLFTTTGSPVWKDVLTPALVWTRSFPIIAVRTTIAETGKSMTRLFFTRREVGWKRLRYGYGSAGLARNARTAARTTIAPIPSKSLLRLITAVSMQLRISVTFPADVCSPEEGGPKSAVGNPGRDPLWYPMPLRYE